MVGSENIDRSLKLKKYLVVTAVCAILVSSLVIVDITSAGHEYILSEPSFTHDFPETVFFYNISEGATSTIFSFIVDIPANHSGQHHIIPREISLLFWFRDASDGSDVSSFFWDVLDRHPQNGTFNIVRIWADSVNIHEDGWWTRTHITYEYNEDPGVEYVSFGSANELILVNTFCDPFDRH